MASGNHTLARNLALLSLLVEITGCSGVPDECDQDARLLEQPACLRALHARCEGLATRKECEAQDVLAFSDRGRPMTCVPRSDAPGCTRTPGSARKLLEQVASAGSARTDRPRATGGGRVVGRAVDQLERRLLVASEQAHTAEGKHARELSTWERWAHRAGTDLAALPAIEDARARIEQLVSGWSDEALFPWQAAPARRRR